MMLLCCSGLELESGCEGFEHMVRGRKVPRQATFFRRGTEVRTVAAGARVLGAKIGEGEEVTLLSRHHPLGDAYAELEDLFWM
jgi:hypothetical protein